MVTQPQTPGGAGFTWGHSFTRVNIDTDWVEPSETNEQEQSRSEALEICPLGRNRSMG
jgi:hypothetical protein